jgi:hypothetical protein
MLVTYALEGWSAWFILAFAGSCALGSVYGFLQGAWPFGLVEAVWSGVALRKWWFTQGKPLVGLIKEIEQVEAKPRFNLLSAFFFVVFAMTALVFCMHFFKH